MRRLENKIAIVTGGAGGIGAATVRRLIEEGAKVVVADLDMDRAAAVAGTYGRSARAIAFDAGNVDSIRLLVEQTVADFGRIDILHNNAAATQPSILVPLHREFDGLLFGFSAELAAPRV